MRNQSVVPVDLNKCVPEDCYRLAVTANGPPLPAATTCIERSLAILSALTDNATETGDGFSIPHSDVMHLLYSIDTMLCQAREIVKETVNSKHIVEQEVA